MNPRRSDMTCLNSSYPETRVVLSATNLRARASRSAWKTSSRSFTAAARPARGRKVFSRVSRLTSTAWSFSTSLGPISSRRGAPRISQSAYLKPGWCWSRSSRWARIPAPRRRACASRALGSTASLQSPFRGGMGTITTWCGATFGGRIRPESSPCVITRPPIIRVDVPQEVDQGSARCWSLSRYSIPYAVAKCCPRLWLVPACSALPSPIKASMA